MAFIFTFNRLYFFTIQGKGHKLEEYYMTKCTVNKSNAPEQIAGILKRQFKKNITVIDFVYMVYQVYCSKWFTYGFCCQNFLECWII